MFRSRNDLAKRSKYVPSISHEVFSCKNGEIEFRCYGVSLVISTPGNPGYYVDYNDIVCVKKSGKWSFYKAQFSNNDLHLIPRASLLCDFMKDEGFSSGQIEYVKRSLTNYRDFNPFRSYIGVDAETQGILKKWQEGCDVIAGRSKGDVLNYIYKQGIYNLTGYRVSDSDLKEYYLSEYQSTDMDNNKGDFYPYKINYVKTTDAGIMVFIVDLVLAVKQDVFLVIPGKNLILKVPGDNSVKIVDFSAADDESVSRLAVELQGILSRTEILQVTKYN